MRFIRFVPASLIAFRALAGPLAFWLAKGGSNGTLIGALLIVALLSDVFDGVVARHLKIATPRLREADSWTDGWFCLWVVAAMWASHRETVISAWPFVAPWFVSDCLAMAFDWWKFRRFASYHALSAKIAGAALFSSVWALFALDVGAWNKRLLTLALCVATLSHLERWLISLSLSDWTPDVLSLWHARHLRSKAHPVQ